MHLHSMNYTNTSQLVRQKKQRVSGIDEMNDLILASSQERDTLKCMFLVYWMQKYIEIYKPWKVIFLLAICKEISIKFSLLASLTQKFRHFIDQTSLVQVFDHCCRRRQQQVMSAFWVPIRCTELLFGENWAQLCWDFKVCEGLICKANFGKCTLLSYKFKIYSRRTETSVIHDESAKAMAYLYGQS